LAARGELPSIRVGRSIRIPRDQLVNWIAHHINGSLETAQPRTPSWAHLSSTDLR
jgi:hypothetical protein